MTRWITGSALALAGMLVLAAGAGAHALLRRSDPAGGATLQRAPAAVTLMFTEQPEPALSTIHVLDSTGRPVSQRTPELIPGDPLALRVSLGPLPAGVYTVSWRTVSRVDGHVTGGAFAFGVGTSPAGAVLPRVASPPPSPLAVAGRWAFYAGVSGLLGAAWVWLFAAPRRITAPGWYLLVMWGLAATGTAGIGLSQADAAGVGIVRLAQTALGRVLAWRALAIVAAGVLLTPGRVRSEWRAATLALVGVAALGGMLAHVMAGHAGATPGPWRLPNVAVQWLHFASIGTWLGGLAALLAILPRLARAEAAAAARRFSAVAAFAIAATAAAGITRAVDEVGRWSALVSTDFGRLVLVKAGLLLTLAALGAVNRYRTVPAASRSTRGLRLVGGAELAVAGIVLAVTGILTGLAPARLAEQAAEAARPLSVTGADFATSVRVGLEIAPGVAGSNHFAARITDYDTGRPVSADRVILRFASADRPDIGASTLALSRTGEGMYVADGTNLSLSGRWTVTLLIERGTASVEVPLSVTARAAAQTVRAIRAPGQPTLYTIDLAGGRVLDSYLDPGRPGFNEVHATFLDAAGKELPIPRLITVTVGRGAEAPHPLPVRRFGPGHFIADARLGPGEWRLEFVATARDGTVIDAHLTVIL